MDVFDIVILGFDRSRPDSPAAGLQRVFPIDQGTAVRLINAIPCTVKRGVPLTAAEQYQSALVAIGARVELRKAEPKPVAPPPKASEAPKASDGPTAPVPASAVIAPAAFAASRFTGAATLKQGSPLDVSPPLPGPSAAPSPIAPHAVLTPAIVAPAAAPPPAAVVAAVASVAPQAATAPAPAITAASPGAGEGWGELAMPVERKLAHAATEPPPPLADAPSEEPASDDPREANRRELFRRLMDPRQTGPSEMSPAEAAGGISMLELDLPPPRAGWTSGNNETVGAEDVSAPLLAESPFVQPATFNGAPKVVNSARPPAVSQPAVEVFEPRADARTFHEALPDAIALSLREGGARWVVVSAGVGLLTALSLLAVRSSGFLTVAIQLVATLLLCAIAAEQAIWVLRAVVDDLDSPDGPDLRSEDLGRYFSAGFNLMCFGFAIQLPFLAWWARHRDQMPGALSSSPLGLIFLCACAFYWPMAVGLQAISENPLSVWSLPRGVRVIGASLVEYTTLVLAAAIMALLPLGVLLLMTRMGLPGELVWLGIGLGMSLSQATIAALMGHIARLHPKAFEDD